MALRLEVAAACSRGGDRKDFDRGGKQGCRYVSRKPPAEWESDGSRKRERQQREEQ